MMCQSSKHCAGASALQLNSVNVKSALSQPTFNSKSKLRNCAVTYNVGFLSFLDSEVIFANAVSNQAKVSEVLGC